MINDTHEFAIFYPQISLIIGQKIKKITDPAILKRLTSVLRLKAGDSCIIFDRTLHVQITIDAILKKELLFSLIQQQTNLEIKPSISVLLPVLKHADLEDAITMITACGVSTIHLVYTKKSLHQWSTGYMTRLERIIIAAAEQSKHFIFPIIHPPQPFESSIAAQTLHSCSIFFDPTGISLGALTKELSDTKISSPILVMVGPEGDLTAQEKAHLKKHNFLFCALTPTILRSSLASAVGIGALRALLK